MESRAWLAVVIAALAFGALGYYYGKSEVPEVPHAAPATVVAAPAGPPTCLAAAKITYDPLAASPIDISPQPIQVEFPNADPKHWAICWTLVVQNSVDPNPFSQIRLNKLDSLLGQQGKPVLIAGDTNLKGKQSGHVSFNDEPLWLFDPNGESYVDIKYDVIAILDDQQHTDLSVDPDIVIKK